MAPVDFFLDLVPIGVAVGGADVHNADDVGHVPAQLEHALGSESVQIDGDLQGLVEANGRSAVEYDVDPLAQHFAVFGT